MKQDDYRNMCDEIKLSEEQKDKIWVAARAKVQTKKENRQKMGRFAKIAMAAAAIIVFSLNTGAYCAETIRGSIESVPQGQMEAGLCVGMSYMQIMMHIILPQAFRSAFPSLFNNLISLVKDTSLAANITVTEMFMQTERIAGRTYQFMQLYIEVALVYLIFCTVLTWLQAWGEKKIFINHLGI